MILLKSCPNCGSRRIRRVRKTITRTYRGKKYRVPNVTYHECPACGERVYGADAVQKIEAHRSKRGRVVA